MQSQDQIDSRQQQPAQYVVYQPSINAGMPVAAPAPSQQQAAYMHVPLINSSYIAERAPSEVSPVVVDESKVVFAKLAKRLKCTSILQMVIGGLSISTAIWSSFSARHHAEKIIAKHPLNQHGIATEVSQQAQPDFSNLMVSRREYALYDTLKNLSFLMLIAGIFLMFHGRTGMKTLRAGKVQVAQRMVKKGKFLMSILAVLMVAICFQVKEMKHIIHPHGPPKHHEEMNKKPEQPFKFSGPYDIDATREKVAEFNSWADSVAKDFFMPRSNVEQIPAPAPVEVVVAEVNAECGDNKDESSCDTIGECSWCKSAAVRSQCLATEDAKKLPASIFACSKLDFFIVEKEMRILEDEVVEQEDTMKFTPPNTFTSFVQTPNACAQTDQDSCNADAACTWCLCSAVPSKCWSLEDSKKLPEAVFSCDKAAVSEEIPMLEANEVPMTEAEVETEQKWKHGYHGRHGKHGEHGEHGHKKHCKFCWVGPTLLIALIAAHHFNVRKYNNALKKYGEDKAPEFKCCKMSQKPKVAVSQSPVIEYSIYNHNETGVNSQSTHVML